MFNLLFYIGGQLINNIELVSGVQQSDLAIHVTISIIFQFLFPSRLLQHIDQSSLCYTVGPYWKKFRKTIRVGEMLTSIPCLHVCMLSHSVVSDFLRPYGL